MKRILVTGANKGIGLAIVTKLLQDYPDTFLLLGSRDIGRGQAALRQVMKQIKHLGKDRVDLIQIDVTSNESVKKAVETVWTKFEDSEPLYGLVNNAGGATGSSREILQLNTYSVRRVTEAFLPLIQKNKGNKYA
jgi:carbonyl reductase 1